VLVRLTCLFMVCGFGWSTCAPLTVADLARHAHLSVTTLHRRFRAEVGLHPLRSV